MVTWSTAEPAGEPTGESAGPACAVCKGSGFIHPRLATGKPDFSRVVPCQCRQQKTEEGKEAQLRKYSNLGALARYTFADLVPQGRSGDPVNQEQFSRAYQAARAFAAEPKGWLVFIGPSGCGKTHLAAAIANERISHNCPVFFQSVPDLLDHLRAAYTPDSELSYDELFEQVCNTPLLILDDLGAQASTSWGKEKLYQLLNHRFLHELPTVITSSRRLEELDDRVRTRVSDPRLSQIFVIEEKLPSLIEYGWPPGFELQKSMTFKSFDWKRLNLSVEQRENLENIYHIAMDYAKQPDGWLVLLGDNGCGKTHLAAAIANYQYEARKVALFVVVSDFLDHLRSTFSPESKLSYDRLFESVKNAPLLILDDFGEQSATPWVQEKLYQMINHRYNARLATVITTSYSLEQVERRISSRLVDPKISMVFNIIAPDYRGDRSAQSPKNTTRRARKGRWE